MEKKMRYTIFLFFLFLYTVAICEERKGFFVGAGYGIGIDDASFFEEEKDEDKIKMILSSQKNDIHQAINIKLGGILTPKLLLGIDILIIKKEIENSKLLFAESTTSFSYFFKNNWFFKMGLGYAAGKVSTNNTSVIEDGLGYILSIGFEKAIIKNIAFNFELSYIAQGMTNFEKSKFVAHSFITTSVGIMIYKDI